MDRKEKNMPLAVVLVLPFCLLWVSSGCGGRYKASLTPEELEKTPFAKRDGLPEPSGGFVLSVAGQTVTADEIILPVVENFRQFAQNNNFATFKEKAGAHIERIVISKLSDVLLYDQAKKEAPEQIDEILEKEAEKEVRKFLIGFGGDWAKAEEALRKMGTDWEGFRKDHKTKMLSYFYIQKQLPEPGQLTRSELLDYYEQTKNKVFTIDAKLKIQLIDIQPAMLDVSEPNQDRYQQAGKLALELLERLRAGEDFSQLAEKYSHGHRAMFGGLWNDVNPQSLAEPYDVLAKHAENMQPEQIAGPIEVPGHIFIVKLKDRQAETVEPFEKVQKQIAEKILRQQRQQAVYQFRVELVQQAVLADRSKFVDFCVQKLYTISNQ